MRLPVVAQDPLYGGGFRSIATAFWSAAVELGHDPRLVYLSRARGLSPRMGGPRFSVREERSAPFVGDAVPSVLPELDALNQLAGGERIARRIRSAPVVWAVAGSAPYAWGALRSGRPYGLWLATDIDDEFASRRLELPRSRRLALAANEPLLRRIERAVLRGARVIATISERSRHGLARTGGIEPETIAIWPVPVDMAAFAPLADAEWQAGLAAPTIVFVGRGADPRKNVGLLADAFPLVRARVPAARLRFVGEPPPPHVLARAGVGVEATGEVDAVPGALRDAALLVLPSLQEGFGIVVAEAFAAGVPAVVTPSGGPDRLAKESGGAVVLHGWDVRELADTVVSLLEDHARLRAMRAAARAYVEGEHSFARFVPHVAEALERTRTGSPPT
jgi:glycosyltransferase involved in cell wall biosynthesis